MNKNLFQGVLKTVFLTGALLTSASVFADKDNDDDVINTGILDQCEYPTLATNLLFPGKFTTENTTVCVDIPVDLKKVKVVFNMDTDSVDGAGNSVGMKHMVMLGTVIKDRISKGLIKPEDVSIIGILHGSGAGWALKTVPTQQKNWIERIFQLKKDGVNIQLEICAATMNGNGWTKEKLYSYDDNGNPDPNANGRIYVNQGAVGRLIYLEQHHYSYLHEGHEDHD